MICENMVENKLRKCTVCNAYTMEVMHHETNTRVGHPVRYNKFISEEYSKYRLELDTGKEEKK